MNEATASPWPDNVWTDYPFAAVRLTTIEYNRNVHLLFGYIELIPEGIPRPSNYRAQPMNVFNGSRLQTSLTVLPSRDALQWYESSIYHDLSVPCLPIAVQTVRLEPEPRLGQFVAANAPPIGARWHAGSRMHRMVPMEAPPAIFEEVLRQPEQPERQAKIKAWLTKHTFIDLTAYPDCVGGLVLLAPNPLLRQCNQYMVRFLDDGREVLGVKAVPRAGRTLDGITVRLREVRPDGQSVIEAVQFNSFGKGEIILPQQASETALEIHCTERGLLFASAAHRFLRSVHMTTQVTDIQTRIEVPNRRKGSSTTRHSVTATTTGFDSQIGEPHPGNVDSRLAVLLAARTAYLQDSDTEALVIDDRPSAVAFIRGLVSRATRQVIFVDPYFSFADIREFALSVSFKQCAVGVLTGREEPGWGAPILHLNPPTKHGVAMAADLEHINRIRFKSGYVALEVKVTGGGARRYHSRFLVVDDNIWHFGHSFNALGDGSVNLVTRVSNPRRLLATIRDDFANATRFEDFWREFSAENELIMGTSVNSGHLRSGLAGTRYRHFLYPINLTELGGPDV